MVRELNVYNIDQSKKVGSIIGTLIDSVKNIDTNKDDKISTMEVLNAVQVNAFKIISNTPDLAALKKEATDYTEKEKAELVALIAEGAQIQKLKAAALFERSLRIVIDVVDLVIDLRKPEEEFLAAA